MVVQVVVQVDLTATGGHILRGAGDGNVETRKRDIGFEAETEQGIDAVVGQSGIGANRRVEGVIALRRA
jgi:hypothetical protein